MKFVVSESQREGWKHPLVQTVKAAAEEKSDAELQETLLTVANGSGLMSPFLPLPFTEDSYAGTRVRTAWNELTAKIPHLSQFVWRFLNPQTDALDAYRMAAMTGTEPVVVNL